METTLQRVLQNRFQQSYSKIEKYVDTLENNNPPSLAGFVTPPFR